MGKKASLSLSINAIIVLILAITMLGLALGFVKAMFGKVSGQVESVASNEPDPRAAGPAELITLSRNTIVLSPSETTAIKFSAYNPSVTPTPPNEILDVPQLVNAETSCIVSDTPDATHPLKLRSQIPKSIDAGTSATSQAIIQAGGIGVEHVCQICTVSSGGLPGACADVRVIIR